MRRPFVTLLCIPAAAALAGCTDDQVARVPGRSVTIVQRDYRLDPQNVSVPHGRVTFLVRNGSKGPHNFVIRSASGARLGRIATLKPGESGKLTVRLRRGTYTMYCAIGHHEQLGESGTVRVR
jgi:plastocyanin